MQFDGIFWPLHRGIQDGEYKLERTRRALDALDNPEKKMKNVVHIAGTNGKGSVSAFWQSVVLKNGFSCGVYTSPHLERLNERIKINGSDISDELLLQNIKEVYYKLKRVGLEETLTFFEGMTVVAFCVFANQGLDFNIIEVGLGGRWDATNVLLNPVISVITSISLDHQDYLGNTIEKIAVEKCEIIKPNSCAVLGVNEASVKEVFVGKCKSVGVDWKCVEELEYFGNYFDGSYQAQNATLAMQSIKMVEEKIGVEFKNVKEIIASTKWKGRLEKVFVPQIQREILVDCAHNVGGVSCFLDFISKQKGKKALIFGMLKRKDRSQIIGFLNQSLERNCVDRIICTNFEGEECVPADLLCKEIAHENCVYVENFTQAFEKTDGFEVFACGSIYMVGSLLAEVKNSGKN